MKTRALRQSIHAREGGKCFYCLRRIPSRMKCLDHVIPPVQFGRNSYRNQRLRSRPLQTGSA